MEIDKDTGVLAVLLTAMLGGIGGLWGWLNARATAREAKPSAMMTAAGDFAAAAAKVSTALGETSQALVVALRSEVDVVRAERAADRAEHDLTRAMVMACEHHRAECTDELRTVNARLDRSELSRQEQQAEIDRMMAGAVPGYTSFAIKPPPP